MKLEHKHLASYFPYALKGIDEINNYYSLCLLDSRMHYFDLWIDKNFQKFYGLVNIKPILFTLSSLTKEITVNGETFVPIYKIYEFEQWVTDELEEIINDGTIEGIYNDLSLIPYSHAEKLFEWKIDVFGLIELGLAEPVTEDFNPYI